MDNKSTDLKSIILTGRIYPAIQSCVGNRYKIIIGYFAIVGFLLVNAECSRKIIEYKADMLLAVVFTVFALFNSLNYWLNAKEQWDLENEEKKKFPTVDVLFLSITLLLIWGGYYVLNQV